MNQFGSILDLYLSSFPFVSHAQGCGSRVKILRLRLGIGLSSSLRPDLGLRTLLLEMGKLFLEHRIGIARTQPLDLANKYGPIMHLKVGQVSVVFISSPELTKELLQTQKAIFSQRPGADRSCCDSFLQCSFRGLFQSLQPFLETNAQDMCFGAPKYKAGVVLSINKRRRGMKSCSIN